jgi:hypothetical protein
MGKFAEASFAATNIGEVYPQYIAQLHGRIAVGAGAISTSDMSVVAGEENVHPNNMLAWSEMAFASNPYMLVEAYDPDSDLEAMAAAIADVSTLAEALDEDADFDTFLQKAHAMFNSYGITDTTISTLASLVAAYNEDADFTTFVSRASTDFGSYGVDTSSDADAEVTAHAARMMPELNRARSHFLASMFEMNTVNTSFHVMGLAYLENEHLWRLEDWRAKIKLLARNAKNDFLIKAAGLMYDAQMKKGMLTRDIITAKDAKDRFLIQAAELMYGAQARKIDFLRNIVLSEQDFYRTKIQTKGVQIQQNLQWDVADINWEPMVLNEVAGIINAMNGVPHFTKQPNDIQQGIANALSIGPQIGMQVGQATGNPGAGMMAAVLGGGLAFMGGGSGG